MSAIEVSNVSFEMPEFLKTDLCSYDLKGILSDGDYAKVIVGVSTYTGKPKAIKLYPKS